MFGRTRVVFDLKSELVFYSSLLFCLSDSFKFYLSLVNPFLILLLSTIHTFHLLGENILIYDSSIFFIVLTFFSVCLGVCVCVGGVIIMAEYNKVRLTVEHVTSLLSHRQYFSGKFGDFLLCPLFSVLFCALDTVFHFT